MYGDSARDFDSFTGQSTFANQPPAPVEWFNALLSTRFRHANFYSAGFAFVAFYLAVVIHQTSLFHPFNSLVNLIYLFFFLPFWFSAICVTVLGFCLSWFFIRKCFHPLYEMNYNIAKFQVVMAALGMFSTYLAVLFFVNCASLNTAYSSWTTFTLFACTAFFSSYQTALGADFRWGCTKSGVFATLGLIWKQVLHQCGNDLAKNVARGYMLATPLCVLSSSLRSTFFDLIFAFNTNVTNFFLVFALQLVVRLMFETINVITMQPIKLPLIGVSSTQTRQQQNLISALTSQDDLLREFGFCALNEIARTQKNSREIIFSLSQPGKKPRNWATIYEVCIRITDTAREMLQVNMSYVETVLGPERPNNAARLGLKLRPVNTPTIPPMARRQFGVEHDKSGGSKNLSNGSANGHDTYQLNQSKHRLLQPPVLNPRTEVPRYKSKIFQLDYSFVPGYAYIQKLIHTFCITFLRPPPSVLSYYLKLAGYAVDTLAVLAAYSIEEDSYGVVQQHLPDILSTFSRLELAIDLYIRSTSNNKAEYIVRENLYALEEVLERALRTLPISEEDRQRKV